MNLVVRQLAGADESAWRPLFAAYGRFYETEFSDEVLASTWTRLMTPGSGIEGLAAELDGEVVGIAHYRWHPDTFSTGTDWYLDDLYVSEHARGQGVATQIIEHLVELQRSVGPGTLRWITAADNERAQRVYDRIATRTTWVTYEVRT